jgi:hypothetical protein
VNGEQRRGIIRILPTSISRDSPLQVPPSSRIVLTRSTGSHLLQGEQQCEPFARRDRFTATHTDAEKALRSEEQRVHSTG